MNLLTLNGMRLSSINNLDSVKCGIPQNIEWTMEHDT